MTSVPIKTAGHMTRQN